MNAEFFALAFLSALNPKLLALDLLLIENRRPRAMFLCLLLGGMIAVSQQPKPASDARYLQSALCRAAALALPYRKWDCRGERKSGTRARPSQVKDHLEVVLHAHDGPAAFLRLGQSHFCTGVAGEFPPGTVVAD